MLDVARGILDDAEDSAASDGCEDGLQRRDNGERDNGGRGERDGRVQREGRGRQRERASRRASASKDADILDASDAEHPSSVGSDEDPECAAVLSPGQGGTGITVRRHLFGAKAKSPEYRLGPGKSPLPVALLVEELERSRRQIAKIRESVATASVIAAEHSPRDVSFV